MKETFDNAVGSVSKFAGLALMVAGAIYGVSGLFQAASGAQAVMTTVGAGAGVAGIGVAAHKLPDLDASPDIAAE